MEHWAGVITAIISGLIAFGGSVKWLWDKIEKRFMLIEQKLDECHKREMEGVERRSKQVTVIELLWQEVQRIAPDSKVFERAKKLLDELKATMAN